MTRNFLQLKKKDKESDKMLRIIGQKLFFKQKKKIWGILKFICLIRRIRLNLKLLLRLETVMDQGGGGNGEIPPSKCKKITCPVSGKKKRQVSTFLETKKLTWS